ncbi:E3 ubiquitin-protein ligase RMND5A [Patella vulgata]|uniref:E3 ubiquitin-protein ligase RMND5A n=1 Tax=Patella vulgata TaxID=6465 RepID=UPI00217FBEC4|nr:E3 ubiquitin-protein ligase RMND5A [Patella vulgata]
MESCLAVERELDRVLAKFNGLRDHSNEAVEELIHSLQSICNELQSGQDLTSTQSAILVQTVKRVRDAVQRVSTEHKELHGSVSKVGKSVDRNFISDFTAVTPDTFENAKNNNLLNEVICEHFLRQGMLDIAESLTQDARLEVDSSRKEPFLELHRILEALKQRDLDPALEWACINRDILIAQRSSLEFKLHRLRFIELIKEGTRRQKEALSYSRNFAMFGSQHARELQVLMGSLLYLPQGIENSPYISLLEPMYWEEICDVFTRDACALMGLSVESPLSVGIRAGCKALPPLLSIKQVMQQRQVASVWSSKDELPVEIELGKEYHYHSIFACPILRQQSNENNPPMRLVCGHVISKDALNKLSSGNKVKCPYCPVEQISTEAIQIYF